MIALDVLIPYYGDPDYLMQAVGSVRELVDTDWRLVIVEDAYPDGRQVEERVANLRDKRITYLRNEKNLGTAGNTQRCIDLAERDYFLIMGADDIVLPNYGTMLAGMLERYPNAALVGPAVEVIDEAGAPHRPLPDRIKELIKPRAEVADLLGESAVSSLLRGNWLYTPAMACRRDRVAGLPHRPDVDAVHDLALVVDVLMRGGQLVISREVAFRYRRHRNSHSSSHARNGLRFVQERGYFTTIGAELREHGWPVAARAARTRLTSRFNALSQVLGALRSGEREAAGRLLSHALGR